MKTVKMEDMNWPDIQQAIDEGYTTVVVAIGQDAAASGSIDAEFTGFIVRSPFPGMVNDHERCAGLLYEALQPVESEPGL